MTRRLLGFLVLIWLLGFLWFALFLPEPASDQHTQGIVVLTGAAGRIERGVALLEGGRGDQLLVSGVNRDVTTDEFAQIYHVPPKLMRCCVTLGREAVDTRSNAIETSAWVTRHDYHTIRIITSDWHMRRARYELARQLEGQVQIVADAVRGEPSLMLLVREYHKYLLRRAAALVGI